jgi:hypothetical protein
VREWQGRHFLFLTRWTIAQRAVIKWSLTNQLRWKTSLVRQVVVDEKAYYQEVVRSSMEALMLYPYHLCDVLLKERPHRRAAFAMF